uniref:Uncharacterized protein n=1 Tax=Arion vulgaris TaxID=1028688 RepID=A0A0B7B679_9EUPU
MNIRDSSDGLKISPIHHQNQDEYIPQLCAINFTLQIRMLENNRTRIRLIFHMTCLQKILHIFWPNTSLVGREGGLGGKLVKMFALRSEGCGFKFRPHCSVQMHICFGHHKDC